MAILVFIIVAIFNISIAKSNEVETMAYTVNKGDTLWAIARKYTSKDKDIRQTIYEIEKLNNLKNATIYPGQTIQIKIGQ